MKLAYQLSFAGFLTTAIAFGPARIGFGLFLPEFRQSFNLSTYSAGWLASATFFCFFVTLLASIFICRRVGARASILLGSFLSLVGLLVAALATNSILLAIGVCLAGCSSGLCWAPFNDLAERAVPPERRARTLSVISTGTTVGIACSGILALGVGLYTISWRWAWSLFSLLALLSLLADIYFFRFIPSSNQPPQSQPIIEIAKEICCSRLWPLAVTAVSAGFTTAVYISFAVDFVSRQGENLAYNFTHPGAMLMICYGLGGLVGLAAGDLRERIGLRALLTLLFTASSLSFILLAQSEGQLAFIVLSALLQGSFLMTISATFSFWSLYEFPKWPAYSFIAVLVIWASGNVLGPAITGSIANAFGYVMGFHISTICSLLTMLFCALGSLCSAVSEKPQELSVSKVAN